MEDAEKVIERFLDLMGQEIALGPVDHGAGPEKVSRFRVLRRQTNQRLNR